MYLVDIKRNVYKNSLFKSARLINPFPTSGTQTSFYLALCFFFFFESYARKVTRISLFFLTAGQKNVKKIVISKIPFNSYCYRIWILCKKKLRRRFINLNVSAVTANLVVHFCITSRKRYTKFGNSLAFCMFLSTPRYNKLQVG